MEQIKESELKNYLGTGLKVQVSGEFIDDDDTEGQPRVFDMVGIVDGEVLTHKGGYIKIIENDIEDIFPLVYPLSMLTEEITVDRETFVPIVELSKLITQASFSEEYIEKWIYNKDQNVATLIYKWLQRPNSVIVRNNFFDIDTDTVNFSIGSFDGENNTEFFDSGCQLQMFQKLFDWHFDVFNWIERGLAIDKSTVKI